MRRKIIGAVLVLGPILVVAAKSTAAPIPVGSGANTSMVSIEFSDGNLFDFAVSYDGSVTGEDLLNRMRDETNFDFGAVFFDIGGAPKLFVVEMRFGESSEGEPGNLDTSPVYYTRASSSEPWWVSPVGATERVVFDGSFDGWTFSEIKIPEPAAIWGLWVAGSMMAWRRRRS